MERRQTRPRLLQAMIDAFSLPDLRRRILITLGILVVFRLIAHIPLPGVDLVALRQLFQNNALLGMFDLFSGGAMRNFSTAAMGVYPYITATIIMQLLQPVIPKLQALSMEGEAGRNKLNMISHILTIPLAAFSGYGQIILLRRENIVSASDPLTTIAMVTALVAGTMFLIWLGELITENGIGNGISIIIFAGIVATIPTDIGQGFLSAQSSQIMGLIFFVALVLATAAVIVIFTEAHRRIPVQYTRSIYRSGRMYRQSGATHIPLRVNMTGMIPLIFSMSMVLFPGLIASYFAGAAGHENFANTIVNIFNPNASLPLGFIYWGLFFLLTFAFAFFYTAIIFQQQDLPNTLQKQGGFIPGVRPGKQTSVYLNSIINRITWAGALFLSVMAIMPFIAKEATGIAALQLSTIGMLIVVGVILDTMKQLEAQLVMRRYEGFIK
jgi:preprotein translocase subunit SecY